ncbi:MAG: carbonic anhydrase [Terriglobia bacterium]
MDCTRRGFASRFGLLLAGVAGGGAWGCPAVGTGASSGPAAQHEQHSRLPMTTHASGNAENKLAPAEEVWANLVAGNRRFVAGKPLVRDEARRRSAVLAGQQPRIVVLACSDSRVSPTLVFDQGLGDLYEVRTAGNVVDALVMGSIEYAVEHLPIRILVILGHEKCGPVAAAASGEKMPTSNLQAVVDKIAPAIAKVKGDRKTQEFLRKAEEANVLQCAVDLLADSPIVLRESAANNIEIIKAVYNLTTGQVRRLEG